MMIVSIWKRTKGKSKGSTHAFFFTARGRRKARLPKELSPNRLVTVEMAELPVREKTMIFCLQSRLTGDTCTTKILFGTLPDSFTHLTWRLVSCCCWWAMVCFTNTLLILCSMAYFLAWERRSEITCKFHRWIKDQFIYVTRHAKTRLKSKLSFNPTFLKSIIRGKKQKTPKQNRISHIIIN